MRSLHAVTCLCMTIAGAHLAGCTTPYIYDPGPKLEVHLSEAAPVVFATTEGYAGLPCTGDREAFLNDVLLKPHEINGACGGGFDGVDGMAPSNPDVVLIRVADGGAGQEGSTMRALDVVTPRRLTREMPDLELWTAETPLVFTHSVASDVLDQVEITVEWHVVQPGSIDVQTATRACTTEGTRIECAAPEFAMSGEGPAEVHVVLHAAQPVSECTSFLSCRILVTSRLDFTVSFRR